MRAYFIILTLDQWVYNFSSASSFWVDILFFLPMLVNKYTFSFLWSLYLLLSNTLKPIENSLFWNLPWIFFMESRRYYEMTSIAPFCLFVQSCLPASNAPRISKSLNHVMSKRVRANGLVVSTYWSFQHSTRQNYRRFFFRGHILQNELRRCIQDIWCGTYFKINLPFV